MCDCVCECTLISECFGIGLVVLRLEWWWWWTDPFLPVLCVLCVSACAYESLFLTLFCCHQGFVNESIAPTIWLYVHEKWRGGLLLSCVYVCGVGGVECLAAVLL